MKESLTKHQVEFLLEYFFKNERYAGWRGIATKLIENGKCIVAGDECIWKGGIGNFVKTNETSLAEGCLEYTFDVISFVENSLWFKEIKREYEKIVEKEWKEIAKKTDEIANKYFEITHF